MVVGTGVVAVVAMAWTKTAAAAAGDDGGEWGQVGDMMWKSNQMRTAQEAWDCHHHCNLRQQQ